MSSTKSLSLSTFIPSAHIEMSPYYITMNQPEIIEPFLIKLKNHLDSDPSLTPAGLATKAGLNNAAIRQWFSGNNRSPTILSARKVCAALNTTLEDFLSDANDPEEREIAALVLQLPVDLRQKLLGYGQGLLESVDPTPPKSNADDQ